MTNLLCAYCDEPIIGAGYDGCSEYCPRDCDGHTYCDEDCFCNANEAAAEREYHAFHAGEGPLPLDEQCRRAAGLKAEPSVDAERDAYEEHKERERAVRDSLWRGGRDGY